MNVRDLAECLAQVPIHQQDWTIVDPAGRPVKAIRPTVRKSRVAPVKNSRLTLVTSMPLTTDYKPKSPGEKILDQFLTEKTQNLLPDPVFQVLAALRDMNYEDIGALAEAAYRLVEDREEEELEEEDDV